MKHPTLLVYASVVLIYVLLLVSYTQNIERIGILASKDPYYHLDITQHTLEEESIVWTLPNSVSNTRIEYFSIIYPLAATLTLVTGIPVFYLYKYASLFLSLLLLLSLIILARRVKNNTAVVIGSMVILSAHYLLTRYIMLLPENLALIFLILIIFFLVIERLELAIIFVLFYYFTHFRSIYIPLLFIFLGFILLNYHKKFKFELKHLVFVLVIILLTIPLLPYFYEALSYHIFNQIVDKTEIVQIAAGSTAYNPLDFGDLLIQTGSLALVFGAIAIVSALKKRTYLFIAIPVVILLILITAGPLVGVYIQPIRFLLYMLLPLTFLIDDRFNSLFTNVRFKIVTVSLLTLLFIITLVSVPHGFSGITPADFRAIDFIKQNQSYDVIIPYGEPYGNFNIKNVEFENDKIPVVYSSESVEALKKNLEQYYGKDKKIILAVSYQGTILLKQNNPNFLEYMRGYEVYSDAHNDVGVNIYEIST